MRQDRQRKKTAKKKETWQEHGHENAAHAHGNAAHTHENAAHMHGSAAHTHENATHTHGNAALNKQKIKKEMRQTGRQMTSGKPLGKIVFEKPGNMLYPVPAVMVSCTDGEGRDNVLTVAWAGTVCSDPPMVSVSIRPSRFSHEMIRKTGEFVINLTTEQLVPAADFCGVRSGRDMDKFEACHLTKLPASKVSAPLIAESPVNIECRVTQVIHLGSHDLFLAEVVAVDADASLMDEKGGFHLEKADLTAWSHGRYYALGRTLGSFGFSVRKTK